MTVRNWCAAMVLGAMSLPAFGQSADQAITVTDAPDPVAPGGNVVYSIAVTNNGPDAATNGGFNAFLPGQVTYIGTTAPAGFTCSTFGAAVSCTHPSFAAGQTANFTLTAQANASLAAFADGSFSTSFSTSGVTIDPNNGNNATTVTTAYDTAQVDLSVAVSDSPDPVGPDQNITYTVTVANAGPDPAANVNFNVFNNNSLRFQSATVPVGFTCMLPAVGGAPVFSCTNPSLASGASVQFIVVLRADDDVLGVNDGSVQTLFGVTSGSNETNSGNDSETETTAYVTPDADVSVSVTDSPDPVGPDQNVTYTATVTNSGPDTAPNVTFSVYNNNSLRFQSAAVPAGFTCTLPAVGAAPIFSCTNPSMASGASAQFSVVLRADDDVLGVNDGSVDTSFTATSAVSDPDPTDNTQTVTTAYVTPDADVSISVTDSPDPVGPDQDITYTAIVSNAGPDTASNLNFNVFNNGSLRFQSATVPAGFTCTLPAVGGTPSFTCTNPSFASGASAQFTVVLRADDAVLGVNDGTVDTVFSAIGATSDPDGTDNTQTVSTAYVTPDADVSVTVGDSPDPVGPNQDITYTATVANAGPDTAPNTAFNVFNNGSLRFQSATVPAGFSCMLPAVGAAPVFTCTNPSFASGASVQFTVVLRADGAVLGNSDGTVETAFSVASAVSDPDNTDNSETETTAYVVPDADLAVTANATPAQGAPGTSLTYTATLQNLGPDPAATAALNIPLHASLRFQSLTAPAGYTCTTPAVGATGTITCTIATLGIAAPETFTLVAQIDPTLTGNGTIMQTFTASSVTADPVAPNNTATVGTPYGVPSADLTIAKTTTATAAAAGATVPYTITLSNAGPDAATSVVVSDALPATLRFASLTAPAGYTCTTPAIGASGTITCTAASLAAGASAVFMLTTTVAPDATGSISNTATGSSATSDPDGAGATSGVVVGVTPVADLRLTKTAAAPPAAITGASVVYTITVFNDGPSAAAGVVVTDVLPAGLQFISAVPSQGTCSGTATVTCSLGTLANGASATVTLTARITASSGTISNTATVTSGATDPDPTDDAGTTPPLPVSQPEERPPVQVPVDATWALIVLALLMAAVAGRRGRRIAHR